MSEVEIGDRLGRGRRKRGRLDRLYRLYSPWLTARIRRRFGVDAEDVVQEAWLQIVPISEQVEIRHPKALLLTVASNIAITRAQKARRRAELDLQRGEAPVAFGADQAEAVLLQQVVLGLPQPLRDVTSVIECYLALSAGRAMTNSRQCGRGGDAL